MMRHNWLIVQGEDGDWQGLYRDGELVTESHSLTYTDIFDAMGVGFTVMTIEQDYMESLGWLPDASDHLDTNTITNIYTHQPPLAREDFDVREWRDNERGISMIRFRRVEAHPEVFQKIDKWGFVVAITDEETQNLDSALFWGQGPARTKAVQHMLHLDKYHVPDLGKYPELSLQAFYEEMNPFLR